MKTWQRWTIIINTSFVAASVTNGRGWLASIGAAVLAGVICDVYDENRGKN